MADRDASGPQSAGLNVEPSPKFELQPTLEKIFAEIDLGVLIVNPQGRILFWNRSMEGMWESGVNPLGHSFVEFLGRLDLGETQISLADMVLSDVLKRGEARLLKNCSYVPVGGDLIKQVNLTLFPIANDCDQTVAAAVVIQDVSTQLQLKKEVQALLQSSGDGIMVMNRNRQIIAFNPASEAITGWSAEEVKGKRCCDFFECRLATTTGSDVSQCPGRELMQGRGNGQPASQEVLMTTRDGRERWLEINYSSMKNELGEAEFLIRTFRDVTERKQVTEELIRAKTLATLGQFASELAHEVKNPLNSIDIQLVLLERAAAKVGKKLRADILETKRVVKEEVTRLNDLVTEYLQFTRSGSPDRRPTDVKGLIGELVALVKPQAERQQVDLRVELRGEFPLVWLDGDKVKQALLNLVINGFEAMPDGGRLTILVSRQVGGGVEIAISDTGKGIPKEQWGKVFDLFYSTKDKGTGIGLPLAQNIILAHSGSLQFTSSDGGTTFSVVLPLTSG